MEPTLQAFRLASLASSAVTLVHEVSFFLADLPLNIF
jgi:hypothetical protein